MFPSYSFEGFKVIFQTSETELYFERGSSYIQYFKFNIYICKFGNSIINIQKTLKL